MHIQCLAQVSIICCYGYAHIIIMHNNIIVLIASIILDPVRWNRSMIPSILKALKCFC